VNMLMTLGLTVDIHIHDTGKWCAGLEFPDKTRVNQAEFESKRAAFDWCLEKFDQWRPAA
jgi:hypothetical protein